MSVPSPSPPTEGSSRVRIMVLVASVVALGIVAYFGWAEWTALDHYRDAQKAIEERKLTEAIDHLTACKRAWPDDGEVAFLLARTARRNQDYVTAADELERAERLDWVAEAIRFERTLMRTQQGQVRMTEEALVTAVRHGHPDSLYVVEILGPHYARTFSPILAREMLDKWIELQPNHPTPYFWLGDLSKRLNQSGASRGYYTKVLELAPDHREATIRLARELLDEQFADLALGYLEPFLKREPNDRDGRLLAARAYLNLNREAQARSQLESLGRDFPDDGEVLLERGRLELRAERYADAEKYLRLAFEKTPFESQVSFNLAKALQGLERPDEAKKFRERFDQIDKDQKYLSELSRKIHLDARNIELRIDFAVVLRRNEQFQAAMDWLITALEIDSRSARLHREIAATYEKLGRPDKARQHLELAKQYGKGP